MKELLKNKELLAIYLLWFFLHTFLKLISRPVGYAGDHFWPFTNETLSKTYDISEWFFYIFAPIICIITIKAFKRGGNDGSGNNIVVTRPFITSPPKQPIGGEAILLFIAFLFCLIYSLLSLTKLIH